MSNPPRPVPVTCQQCGLAFITKPSQPRKYCSRKCKGMAQSLNPDWHTRTHGKSHTTEMVREYQRRFFERHPGRATVKNTVKDAIRKGVLVKQPCEKCGDTKVQAHHDDYSKPLQVRWLCKTHHWDIHAAQRRELRDSRRAAKASEAQAS